MRAGRVTVNGRVARLGESADPVHDAIAVDGRRVRPPALDYWMVHKPRGVVTTRRDPQGRPTVMDLVPPSVATRLAPVGRLDRDTEGLVLLTNDGDAAHALLHPSHGSEREYRVTVRGRLASVAAERIARGLVLDGRRTAKAEVGPRTFDAREDTTTFRLVLREGRKRQIRRMLASVGHPVVRLVRVRFGPIGLNRLGAGRARPLRADERRALRRHLQGLSRGSVRGACSARSGNQGAQGPKPASEFLLEG